MNKQKKLELLKERLEAQAEKAELVYTPRQLIRNYKKHMRLTNTVLKEIKKTNQELTQLIPINCLDDLLIQPREYLALQAISLSVYRSIVQLRSTADLATMTPDDPGYQKTKFCSKGFDPELGILLEDPTKKITEKQKVKLASVVEKCEKGINQIEQNKERIEELTNYANSLFEIASTSLKGIQTYQETARPLIEQVKPKSNQRIQLAEISSGWGNSMNKYNLSWGSVGNIGETEIPNVIRFTMERFKQAIANYEATHSDGLVTA
ncbi:hypothetical protein HOK51_03850 [Candidatus Woesearchaeota archaeon]|jgi:hypothetical protein|nr:hypothetical protein [Candidatus Woesearchaeota archaeon]MBT6518956.1 hypothetical protein [Candidatus Woesearchaeota archaeon]MBT7368321.1 hypothetical protein [Candidatus Woesearchaeota archaeon]